MLIHRIECLRCAQEQGKSFIVDVAVDMFDTIGSVNQLLEPFLILGFLIFTAMVFLINMVCCFRIMERSRCALYLDKGRELGIPSPCRLLSL